MSDFVDYYVILGIPVHADAAKVRSRYRQLVKRHHPDMAKGDKVKATETFRLIKEAYEVLSDKDRRLRYDQERQQYMLARAMVDDQATRAGGREPDGGGPAWKRACRDNPELERICEHLAQLSPSLVREFREVLLHSNDFVHAAAIATRLKAGFLARYLDDEPQLLNFPEWIRERC